MPATEVRTNTPTEPVKKQETDMQCTIDIAVRKLAADLPLENCLMWEYVLAGRKTPHDLKQALLGAKIGGKSHTMHYREMKDQVWHFWDLHSKFVAPSCKQLRQIYTEVLSHVVTLSEGYKFFFDNDEARLELFRKMAEECGQPDTVDENRDENFDFILDCANKNGLRALADKFLTDFGDIPASEGIYADRVNTQMVRQWYYRPTGLLAHCRRLVTRFLENVLQQSGEKLELRQEVINLDSQNLKGSVESIVPSFIMFGADCRFIHAPITTLKSSFWGNPKVRNLIDNPFHNAGRRRAICQLFVYSAVDDAHGLGALIKEQEQRMTGIDKKLGAYDGIMQEHIRKGMPPFRTATSQGGSWPQGSVMENKNYGVLLEILDGTVAKDPIKVEPVDTDLPPAEKKSKALTVKEESDVREDVVPMQLTTEDRREPPSTEESVNYTVLAGVAAIFAGVCALAMRN